MIQYKSVQASSGIIKDVDEKSGIVTGYFSIFGNVDHDGDMVVPGAFTKTLKENGPVGKNRIKHLWQHNPNEPLARPHVLQEDAKGLYFESKISETTKGKDVIILYKDGVIDEHSFGYEVINKNQKSGYTELTELRVWEGSSVTWGANYLSRGSMKSMDDFNYVIDERDKLLKTFYNSTASDEMLQLIELRIKFLTEQLTQFYKDLTTTVTEPDDHSADLKDDLKADDVAALIKSINFKIG